MPVINPIDSLANLATKPHDDLDDISPDQHHKHVYDETPSGAIDSNNDTYAALFTPTPAASMQLFLNGMLQEQGAGNDYTLSGLTITMLDAPKSSPGNPDKLKAFYTATP